MRHMAIDKSGQWCIGEAVDLDEYVTGFAETYGTPVQRVVHASCATCSSNTFRVRVDDEQGFAERTCVNCSAVSAMFDSADVADDANPEGAACPCGNETFQVSGGFSLWESGEVRWVFAALRCAKDGVLGVYADWKIDYEPSTQLFGHV